MVLFTHAISTSAFTTTIFLCIFKLVRKKIDKMPQKVWIRWKSADSSAIQYVETETNLANKSWRTRTLWFKQPLKLPLRNSSTWKHTCGAMRRLYPSSKLDMKQKQKKTGFHPVLHWFVWGLIEAFLSSCCIFFFFTGLAERGISFTNCFITHYTTVADGNVHFSCKFDYFCSEFVEIWSKFAWELDNWQLLHWRKGVVWDSPCSNECHRKYTEVCVKSEISATWPNSSLPTHGA